MEKLMLAIGIALLLCAVVAVGLYGWHGNWGPVLLTLGAAFVGKMALGFVELLLVPFSLPSMYFAKRGNSFPSIFFGFLSALATRGAYAAYCAAIVLYLTRTPGPPSFLAVALAVVVASAPFHWAASRASGDNHPTNIDLMASMLGVLTSGILLALGVNEFVSLTPIAVLFFVSAISVAFWWTTIGMRQTRIRSLLSAD